MSETAARNEIWATGRRKTSVARIKLSEGTGKISVNNRSLDGFLGNGYIRHKSDINRVLKFIPEEKKYDIFVKHTRASGSGRFSNGSNLAPALDFKCRKRFGHRTDCLFGHPPVSGKNLSSLVFQTPLELGVLGVARFVQQVLQE